MTKKDDAAENTKYHLTVLDDSNHLKPNVHNDRDHHYPKPKLTIKPVTWRDAFYDFTQNTTFHGIRYVSAEDSVVLRRLAWFFVISLCTAVMTRQIVDRIIYYYGYPVTVNVEINFNETLTFPSVVLCNMNWFRVTEATRLGLYPLLDDMHNREGGDGWKLNLTMYNAENLNSQELLAKTSHRKEDMIVWCRWNDGRCDSDDFVPIFTDFGPCYAFNHGAKPPIRSSETGSENGLRLIMNVEQYEYMRGPHDSAGIKMLLYEHNEVPLVHDLGQALSTGTHTYAGIKVTVMKNLPKPHGNCTEGNPTHYYETYSQVGCRMSCKTNFYETMCGCRLAYMPSKNGNPPVCTISQESCIKENKMYYRRYMAHMCKCDLPCTSTIYEPNFSYSTTSYLDVDTVKSMLNSSALLERYIKARDTKAAVVNKYFNENSENIARILRAAREVEELLVKINSTVIKYTDHVDDTFDELISAWRKKKRVSSLQQHVCLKNFYRGVMAMDEATWSEVPRGYFTFVHTYEQYLNRLVFAVNDDPIQRQMLYLTMFEAIKARKGLALLALENCTQAFASYNRGQAIFNYPYKSFTELDARIIAPIQLLQDAVTRTPNVKRYIQSAADHLKRIDKVCDNMTDYLRHVYDKGFQSSFKMRAIIDEFLSAIRGFYRDRDFMLSDVYSYPERVLADRIERFDDLKSSVSETYSEMKINLNSLRKGVKWMITNLWPQFLETSNLLHDYLANQTIGWTSISRQTTAPRMEDILAGISTYFDEVRTRTQSLKDNWVKMRRQSLDIWKFILTDEDSQPYYRLHSDTLVSRNISWAQTNYTEFKKGVIAAMVESGFNLVDPVSGLDIELTESLQRLMSQQRQYLADNKIGTKFYRENFLQIDIFYRKLNYELVEQQIAYDIFALLCDIGGAMGLFIGASVLTVFEVLDLLGYQSCRKRKIVDPDEEEKRSYI
ncbi:degenerin-like protein del-10 [Tubulanus polymorphus]|uniref:degenerin-like protein del-10 n=1 Tax=Tubulanus polymorphus TaxID=672921 RepID=UPI003DA41846